MSFAVRLAVPAPFFMFFILLRDDPADGKTVLPSAETCGFSFCRQYMTMILTAFYIS